MKEDKIIKELELRIKVLELEIEKLKLEGKTPAYIPYPQPVPSTPYSPYNPYTITYGSTTAGEIPCVNRVYII